MRNQKLAKYLLNKLKCRNSGNLNYIINNGFRPNIGGNRRVRQISENQLLTHLFAGNVCGSEQFIICVYHWDAGLQVSGHEEFTYICKTIWYVYIYNIVHTYTIVHTCYHRYLFKFFYKFKNFWPNIEFPNLQKDYRTKTLKNLKQVRKR